MLNPLISELTDYPFDRLRALLEPLQPPKGLPTYVLSIGEPRHEPPALVTQVIAETAAGWGRYPPIDGTAEFRAAACEWLTRRFALPDGLVDPDRHILPVAGTREALFLIAQAAVPPIRAGGPPFVLMPNPFYQVYLGAAVFARAQPLFLPAAAEQAFLPDLGALDAGTLARTALIYLCSPANPQGAVMPLPALTAAVQMAREYDAVVCVDECYTDIYDDAPPAGTLQACAALGAGLDNVVCFHSLSKRSSVPGLRSGFVVGDARLIAAFRRLRAFGGASVPLPVLAASTTLWQDDAHAEANRALYRAKLDLAQRLLGGYPGFVRPQAAFFLWLDVGDGERFAGRLWQEAAVRVLPGAYLARPDQHGDNPGKAYVRIALVDDLASTEDALTRVRDAL